MIRGGFKLIIHDARVGGANGQVGVDAGGQPMELGTVTLEADNAVVWVRNAEGAGGLGGFVSTPDRPIELYLQGNIVFNQGQRVIYADSMYYNVSSEYAWSWPLKY